MKYIIYLEKNGSHFYMECNEAIVGGKKKLLHNEIMCSFVVEDGAIRVLSGWHIGTEDFEWDEDDKEDYTWVLEKYHPGISKQLLEMIERGEAA